MLRVADLELDENSHEVTRAGVEVHLTATEFELLRYLMRNERVVLSKAQILDRVWKYDFQGQSNIVELYIGYLRKKVDAVEPKLIHTVRGAGYVIKAPRSVIGAALPVTSTASTARSRAPPVDPADRGRASSTAGSRPERRDVGLLGPRSLTARLVAGVVSLVVVLVLATAIGDLLRAAFVPLDRLDQQVGPVATTNATLIAECATGSARRAPSAAAPGRSAHPQTEWLTVLDRSGTVPAASASSPRRRCSRCR